MTSKFFFINAFLLFFFGSLNAQAEKSIIVYSPNKLIKATFNTSNNKLQYQISYKNEIIINTSQLGLVVNDTVLSSSKIKQIKQYTINENYQWRGVHSKAINYCKGIICQLYAHQNKLSYSIEARLFNDGLAFRYILNGATDNAIVNKDKTTFAIPAESTVWYQKNIKYYEGAYKVKKIEEMNKEEALGPPVTIQLPNKIAYAAITEAGLINFAGMSLVADSNYVFHANLSGVATVKGNSATPWRVIMIGANLNTLVNCDIVHNVSPSLDTTYFKKGFNTSWIKPGRSVWSWLAKKREITLDNMKAFTDMAAQLGFEYNLVDEGWGKWKADSKDEWDIMKELVDYSAKKKVGIWVWKAYPDRKGIAGIKDAATRIAFFKKCKAIGIAGIKIDFFDAESQEIIQFYQAALRDAATFQLMINFHGANKPTGETRMWLNEMTREAIRGMENQPPWAVQNTILPFTRLLAGHADYTPLHLGYRLGETSWSHQIASAIIYTSPFLCFGADPTDIVNNPFKNIIQNIPSTWDETIALPPSEIGKLAFFAKRKGNIWWLAAMNENINKTISVNLSFLSKGNHKATIITDDNSINNNAIGSSKVVNNKTILNVTMNAAGGFVIKID